MLAENIGAIIPGIYTFPTMQQHLHKALEISGISDAGCSRTNNEDCITWNSELGLALVADGMGGAKAGEIASRIAAETILKEVRVNINQLFSKPTVAANGEQYSQAGLILFNALNKANGVILGIAEEQLECKGMGATTVAALFHNNKVSVGHVGDSRLYLLRNGVLRQITEDHTVIYELVKCGLYTKKQAEDSVNKNIVTRAVGVTKDLRIDILEESALPGDIFMLCSDGLTDLVPDSKIQETLEGGGKLSYSAQKLVDLAKKYGGSDNISLILIQVLKSYPAKHSFAQRVLNWFS
jgi:PPM family protein phosphatase